MTANELANAVVIALCDKNQKVSTAESCTGGMLSTSITSISGSSNVFEYGIIAYANRIKETELGVSPVSLEIFGAVSDAVAREMAEGIRDKANSDFGVSVTGIAGPGGGTPLKPVGTVYIAVATREETFCELLSLGEACGFDREEIRKETTVRALLLLKKAMT